MGVEYGKESGRLGARPAAGGGCGWALGCSQSQSPRARGCPHRAARVARCSRRRARWVVESLESVNSIRYVRGNDAGKLKSPRAGNGAGGVWSLPGREVGYCIGRAGRAYRMRRGRRGEADRARLMSACLVSVPRVGPAEVTYMRANVREIVRQEQTHPPFTSPRQP